MADLLEMGASGDQGEGLRLSAEDRAYLDNCTLCHALTPDQNDRVFEINAGAREFMELILLHVSSSQDRSAALRAVRQARLWANEGIALEGGGR